MQITTGGNMLNFGYWDDKTNDPLQAQHKLSSIVGEFACLQNARILLDVGSGFSAPAIQWNSQYNSLQILCLNLNLNQLKSGLADTSMSNSIRKKDSDREENKSTGIVSLHSSENSNENVFHLNATSMILPLRDNSVDRVIAFESAQHFKPLIQFIRESKRILQDSTGLMVVAMPVVKNISDPLLHLPLFVKLGILSLTWASEHYKLEYIISMIKNEGLRIKEVRYVGSNIYEPLANYYINNRKKLKSMIMKEYPQFLETILYKSLLKLKTASHDGIIEYVLLKITM
jgi:cyclopropane fatty-acyl-phospholipid synthase-like methyltransferase